MALMETAKAQQERLEENSGLNFSHRNGHRRMRVNWNYLWMPFAAAVVLMVALGIYSFQAGKHKGQEAVRMTPAKVDPRVGVLEQQLSDAGHEHELFKAQLADRDRMIAELRHHVEAQSAALSEMKSAQVNLDQALQSDEAKNQQLAQERSNLSQQFDAAKSSLQKTQAELDSLQQQRAQDQSRSESLEAQIRDLHGQLRDREQALDKQQELLAHDRDIRELMGARELYIAEVYDVARDGQTKKPYGRVFYTKGRSLVFYAYDLDQQSGIKRTSTFQAWGSRGADRQQATNLGIFYEDNAAKKRWVLKADDPKKLAQIDAVFVTVEPNGGSLKPSGKPLLFAYLKVEPNHP
jgi:predicted  nucleic acid-binding Zn-ribbon protein